MSYEYQKPWFVESLLKISTWEFCEWSLHCQNVDPSPWQCQKYTSLTVRGYLVQKGIFTFTYPPSSPYLAPCIFFFFFLFLRIKTQLDGHHLALLLIRSHQLWWRHWTILHMKISSTAAKNDSIVRIIVFSSRRLTLMVI